MQNRDKVIPRKGDDHRGGNLDPTYGMVYSAGCDAPTYLASGTYGRTFTVTFRKTKAPAVLKLGDVNKKEIDLQREAAYLGIGPDVYAAGISVAETKDAIDIKLPYCALLVESGAGFKVSQPVGYIVMEKLAYTFKFALDLPSSIPVNTYQHHNFIELFKHCYANNFVHGDLHPGNIMWSVENSHWKMIDFGFKTEMDKDVVPVVTKWQYPYAYTQSGFLTKHVMRSFKAFREKFNPPRMSKKMLVCYEWWQLVNIYRLAYEMPSRWGNFVYAFNGFMEEHLRRVMTDGSVYNDAVLPTRYVKNFVPLLWKRQQDEYAAAAAEAAQKKAEELAAKKKAEEEAAALIAAQKKALEDAEQERLNKMKLDEGLVSSIRAEIAGEATNSTATNEPPGPMLTRKAKKQLLASQKKIAETKKQASLLVQVLKKETVAAEKERQDSIAGRTRAKTGLFGAQVKPQAKKAQSKAEEIAQIVAAAEAEVQAKSALEKSAQEEVQKAEADAAAAEVAIASSPEPEKEQERQIQAEKIDAAKKRKREASIEKDAAQKKWDEAVAAAESGRYIWADEELKRRQKAQRLGASVQIMETVAAIGQKVKSIWETLATQGSELSSIASDVLSEAIETYAIAESVAEEEAPEVAAEDVPPPPPPDPEVVEIVSSIDQTLLGAEKLREARTAWTDATLKKIDDSIQPLLKMPVLVAYVDGDTVARAAAQEITQALAYKYLQDVETDDDHIQSFLGAFFNALYAIITRVGDPTAANAEIMFTQFFNELAHDLFKKSEVAVSNPPATNNDDDGEIVISPLKFASPKPAEAGEVIKVPTLEEAIKSVPRQVAPPAFVIVLGGDEDVALGSAVASPSAASTPASLVPQESVVLWTSSSKPKIATPSASFLSFKTPSPMAQLPDGLAKEASVKISFLASPEDAEKVGIAPQKFAQICQQQSMACKMLLTQYEGPTYSYVTPPSQNRVSFGVAENVQVTVPPYEEVKVPEIEALTNDAVLAAAAAAQDVQGRELLSELEKAKQKARRHWRRHPRGERADKARLARNVVTTAADYIPSKNDFAGVDTPQ